MSWQSWPHPGPPVSPQPPQIVAPQATTWVLVPISSSRRQRRDRLIGLGIVGTFLVALAIAIGTLLIDVGRLSSIGFDAITASHGRLTNFTYASKNGRGTYEFIAAPGVGVLDGPTIACSAVRPTLERHGLAAAHFLVISRTGAVIADDTTDCSSASPGYV